MTSIIILVHNACDYVKNTIETLQMTKNKDYEVIVLDNASEKKVQNLLLKLYQQKKIDKLIFSKENTLFARGNNIAFRFCNPSSDRILLLNSDIDIRNPYWLDEMNQIYEKGIVSLGIVRGNPYTRVDGFCFMIDKSLYEKYLLDENFEWWWSITKLQAEVLKDGYPVKGVENYHNLIFHYGGMSGTDFKDAKGMQVDGEKVVSWFESHEIKIIDHIDNDNMTYHKNSKANRIYRKLKNKK